MKLMMKLIKEKSPVVAGLGDKQSGWALLSVNRIAYSASFSKVGFCEVIP